AVALEATSSTPAIVPNPGWGFRILTMMTLTTGTILVMWIGEQITERGIGNGISLIIFAGIVVGLPSAAYTLFMDWQTGDRSIITIIFLLIMMLAVTSCIGLFDRAQ